MQNFVALFVEYLLQVAENGKVGTIIKGKTVKWVFENYQGIQVYYKAEVVNKIKEIVQETINKRPHSDNQIFENILEAEAERLRK